MGDNYKETRGDYGERNRVLRDYNEHIDEKEQRELDLID